MAQAFYLIEASEQPIDLYGGKVWRLGYGMKQGMAVPDGLLIPHEVMSEEDAAARASILEELIQPLGSKDQVRYAVRSSSTFEDNLYMSGAGIFSSELGIQGTEALISSVLKCWEAVHSPLVLKYAERFQIAKLRLNIFIQEMVDAKRSGVLINNRPEQEMFIAEGVLGLGLDVVSGEVTPDLVVAELIGTARCLHRRKGKQNLIKQVVLDQEGLTARPLSAAEAEALVFDDEFVQRLARFAASVLDKFGIEQEVEWAEDNQGTIWLIQTRPLTSKNTYKNIASLGLGESAF
ncbi:PEP/pyruvate-binding domain-containing protein [Paenibacillus polymyxa]|uniref:PEP/pyruvate-binding domain-containing protein n=1 Tax=Paenibacillus polymyxa TaxID=1406 RepID=UPI00307DD703